MAQIRQITLGSGSVRPHSTEVDCTYQVVHTPSGDLLHLATYGSDDRLSPPKVSQTIQFDRGRARELLTIIRNTFPGIDSDA